MFDDDVQLYHSFDELNVAAEDIVSVCVWGRENGLLQAIVFPNNCLFR